MSNTGGRSLAELADEKLAKAAAAKKEEADRQAAELHKRMARTALEKSWLDKVQQVAHAKAAEAKHVTCKRDDKGLLLEFQSEALRIEMKDVGDSTVDFCGTMWVGDAKWHFYFTSTGNFVCPRFTPHPILAPNLHGDQHPNGPAQFKNWVVDMAKVAGVITTQPSGLTLETMIHAGIAKMIDVAEIR